MRLNSLVLKGFKSFADETRINFNENLIGIVGPNGSGKSNIVDAIRWVLGEQKTSELRLESMSDVLFNGTVDRKEGRVARVTMTFDNTRHILPVEFSEVSISRILYRNGAGEYRLNDVPCRRKDITSLFIDSGIGSHSYAIISLNMVEDILHDKGGFRRYMIEQAAGIAKYKLRKKETLAKLRRTSEDLDRVSDLLFEIEQQMKSFERQAKRTEKFNRLKDKYRETSLIIAHRDLKSKTEALSHINQSIESTEDAKRQLITKKSTTEAELEKLKTAILTHEKSLSTEQAAFNRLIEELGSAENQKNLVNQKIADADRNLMGFRNRLKRIQDEYHTINELISQVKIKRDSTSPSVTEALKAFDAAKAEYQKITSEYEEVRTKSRRLKELADNTASQSKALSGNIESLKTMKNILEQDVENISLHEGALKKELNALDHLLQEAMEGRETAKAELNGIIEKSELSKNDTNHLQEELARLNRTKSELDVDRQNTVRKLKFYKEIIEKGEGLPEGIQSLLKQDPGLTVFKDTFSVPDEQLITLVEYYFEPILNHLVLNTRDEAISYISAVRDQQKGKIGTLILDELIPFAASPSPPTGLTPLFELIEADKRFENLLQFLCKDVYVNVKEGLEKARPDEKNPNITVLYPYSFSISGRHFVRGGSNTLFEGTQIGRKKEIEKMKARLIQNERNGKALEEKVSQIKIELDKSAEVNSLILKEEEEKRNEISQLDHKILRIEGDIRYKTERSSQLAQELTEKNNGIQECAEELKRVEEALKNLTQAGSGESVVNITQERLDILYDRQLKQRHSMEQLQAEYLQLKNEVDLADKELEIQTNALTKLMKEEADLGNSTQQLQDSILSLKKEKEGLDAQLHEKYEKKEAFQKKLSTQEDSYYSEKGRVFELEKDVAGLRDQLYEKENQLNHFSEKVQSLKFDIQSVRERASIEFQTNLDDDVPDEEAPEFSMPIEELKIKREKAQQKITTFGEINPMAITAYNEIKERHEHISGERDDILEAKESLEETISEIELSATSKFTEALDGIRNNFRNVFQGLFSEDDDCDIVLYDDQDPLEASIEIVAKPKGKKPKSISQLSGGEKTLTAVSFLFALYLLKPAPFCIFDEVDAPLDDVNVLKFNKLIRRFSSESQFIIITHNKLTMAEADILYGVYLKEKGVSGVSAVDFRAFENVDYMEAMGKVG
jgi:chromosome segregation protein